MAMLLISLIQPTNNGITAPPDIAIITSPDISLLLSGNLPMTIENTRGQIFATDKPIIKTRIQAKADDLTSKITTRQSMPNREVRIKNFRDDIFVSIMAPAKVPSIRPKK